MFCGNCGNQIEEGSQFCSICGAPAQADAGQRLAQHAGADEAAARKRGRGKPAAIAAVVAAVVAALVIAAGVVNAAWIENFVRRTFSSPEQYYQFVEGKYLSKMSKQAVEWYGAYALEALNLYDRSFSREWKMELGEDGEELLGLLSLAGVDVSWFRSAVIRSKSSVKEDVLGIETKLQLNQNDILSGTMVVDMGEDKVYVRVPEVCQKYVSARIHLDTGYGKGYDALRFLAVSEEVTKALPAKDEMEKRLDRYTRLVLQNVKDVKMGKEELTVEGISQQCTVLDVVMDSEAVKAIVDEVYEHFQQSFNDAMERTEYLSDADMEMQMQIYVDGKGEIIGRKITLNGGLDAVTIQNFMPRKGGKFGYELSGKSGAQAVKLSGSGKAGGGKINGDFSVKYNGASFIDLTVRELNIKDFQKGYLNASVEAQMSPQFGRLLAGRNPYLSIAQKLKLNMEFASSPKSYSCRLGIFYDDRDLGSIVVLDDKIGEGVKPPIPKDGDTYMIEDVDDLREWLEDCDLKELTASLKKADIPSKYTDTLEEINNALEDGNWLKLIGMMYLIRMSIG